MQLVVYTASVKPSLQFTCRCTNVQRSVSITLCSELPTADSSEPLPAQSPTQTCAPPQIVGALDEAGRHVPRQRHRAPVDAKSASCYLVYHLAQMCRCDACENHEASGINAAGKTSVDNQLNLNALTSETVCETTLSLNTMSASFRLG